MKKILLGFLVLGTFGFAQIRSNTNALSQAQTTLSSTQENRGQTNSDPQPEMVHQSPFDAVKGLKEDLSKRDAFSKHYINEDGSFTALIGAGPIHYEKNGQFLDIDHTITQSSTMNFPFANTTNLMESYFGATSHTGIKNKTTEGEVKEFLNTQMYWEVNGQAVGTVISANVPVSIVNDKAYYNNLYGNIAAEFAVLTGKRELNYIIHQKQDLGNIPDHADYLVFSEDVVLPYGWTHSITENGILIQNQFGKEMYLYENPVSTDAKNELRQEENTVFETALIGNTLTIKTKVKTDWLLSNERVFPVKVDPTVNVYPDVTTGWTKSVAIDGHNYNDFQFGMDVGYFVRGFIKYNLTSISSSAIISSASGYVYIFDILVNSHNSNAFRFKNALDPTANSGTTLYNSATTFYSSDRLTNESLGWKNSTFNSEGLSTTKNNFGGYLSLSVDPGGSWHNTSIYKMRNHIGGPNGDLKPYLLIDYTSSIACSGTPTGGTASIDPNSGTHGEEFSISVDGSTNEGGITYQWEISESSSGPWTAISGATNNTYSGEAPYENGTTYYRRKITCTNSNESAYSTVVSFVTTCLPSHTEGNSPGGGYGYLGISNVNIGVINNTTGYQNQPPAYNYYNLTTDVEVEETYTLKVTYKDDGSPYNPGKIGVWVDWNEDGDFNDTDEFIEVKSNIAHNTQVTFNITVPAGTTEGIKRLRVRSAFNEEIVTSVDACTILVYGETEDYNLNVVEPINCDPVTATADKYSVCSGDTVTLSAQSTTTGYTYTWYKDWNNDTHSGTELGTGTSINVNPTESTVYGVVATKTGCPTGVEAAYALIAIGVAPPPTIIVLDPIEAIACSSDAQKIEVVDGGEIPETILEETFDPLTNNWIIEGLPGKEWKIVEDGTSELHSPDNSRFIMAKSDGTVPGMYDAILYSQPLSFTDYNSGSTDITLEFDHYFRQDLSASTAHVEITVDDTNWIPLETYTTTQGAASEFKHESIDLNHYKGNEYIKIRFKYSADNAWYWAMDNIKIIGTNPNATTITWSPFEGLFMDEAKTIAYSGENTNTVYASPISTTTYTALAKTAMGCPAEATVTIEKGDKIWMGNNTDWLAETNWSENSVPTADHCVKIPETSIKPVISAGEQFAKSLEVETGGGLIINENSSLTVTNQIVNNASATDFVIKDGANLVQINNDAVNEGEITVERDFNFSAERKQYNFIISPVEGQTIKTIYPGNPRVIEYVEGQNWFVEAGLGVYVPGKGYSIREVAGPGVETVTATLKGKPANGVIAFTLKYDSHPNQQEGADDKGYNLVGNPYPSSLDLDQLYAANATNMEPTFQFWDNRGNTQYIQNGSEYEGVNYAQYNALNSTGVTAGGKAATGATGDVRLPNHLARVGTAFMIRALEVGKDKDLVFKNEYRSASNENSPEFFGKNNEINLQKDRYWLTLTTPTNISLMNAVVYFENGNDAYSMDDSDSNGSSDDLYTLVDEHQIAIQGKSSFVVNDTIVLGYRAFETGEHRIDIFDQEGIFANGQNIYLIDRDLDIIHNLSEGAYHFRTEAGEFNDRFVIVYEEDEVLSTIDFANGDIQVYRQDKITVIRSLKQDLRELKIFNLNGQLLLHEDRLSGKYYHLPEGRWGKQVLLLNAKTADGKLHSFKILTH